jgi:periplasmic divalent cation tolerance protein
VTPPPGPPATGPPITYEVVITADDADWLAAFTRTLVEDGLVASGNIVTGVRSIYRWRGVVEDQPEAMVLLHTQLPLVARVIERARAEHPYELPGIRVATLRTTPEYERWVHDSTGSTDSTETA